MYTLWNEERLENMGNVLAKVVKKIIFSKMKLVSILMKKRASIPSKICPVFEDLEMHFQAILKISCFLYSWNSGKWFLDEW